MPPSMSVTPDALTRRLNLPRSKVGAEHEHLVDGVVDRAREVDRVARRAAADFEDGRVEAQLDLEGGEAAARGRVQSVDPDEHLERGTVLLELQARALAEVHVVERGKQVGIHTLRRVVDRRAGASHRRGELHGLPVVVEQREATVRQPRQPGIHGRRVAAGKAEQVASQGHGVVPLRAIVELGLQCALHNVVLVSVEAQGVARAERGQRQRDVGDLGALVADKHRKAGFFANVERRFERHRPRGHRPEHVRGGLVDSRAAGARSIAWGRHGQGSRRSRRERDLGAIA
eukprot:scaffold28310_cov67-Phaeocystis_antarctica.AAC.3